MRQLQRMGRIKHCVDGIKQSLLGHSVDPMIPSSLSLASFQLPAEVTSAALSPDVIRLIRQNAFYLYYGQLYRKDYTPGIPGSASGSDYTAAEVDYLQLLRSIRGREAAAGITAEEIVAYNKKLRFFDMLDRILLKQAKESGDAGMNSAAASAAQASNSSDQPPYDQATSISRWTAYLPCFFEGRLLLKLMLLMSPHFFKTDSAQLFLGLYEVWSGRKDGCDWWSMSLEQIAQLLRRYIALHCQNDSKSMDTFLNWYQASGSLLRAPPLLQSTSNSSSSSGRSSSSSASVSSSSDDLRVDDRYYPLIHHHHHCLFHRALLELE